MDVNFQNMRRMDRRVGRTIDQADPTHRTDLICPPIMATKEDYVGFAQQLAAIGHPIVVAFEATRNCHRTLAHGPLTAGVELHLISSVALAITREAPHNGRDRNDPNDTQVILHMLRIGATQRYVDPLAAGSPWENGIMKASTGRFATHWPMADFLQPRRGQGAARSLAAALQHRSSAQPPGLPTTAPGLHRYIRRPVPLRSTSTRIWRQCA